MRMMFLLMVAFVVSKPIFADVTPWTQHMDVAESRIIAANSHADAEGSGWFAWELRLQPGWKVYWRSPGEAGLPPKLHLKEGSTLKAITPFFPLPKRFELYGMQTFGYGIQFVLPFKVDGGEANKPISLDMTVDFMICKDICIPFTTEYQLAQSGENNPQSELNSATISLWRDKVPDTSGEPVGGLKITKTVIKGAVGYQSLIFEVEAEQNLSRADMLIESDELFSFGKPKIDLRGKGNKALMIVSVDGGKKKIDIKGRHATLTFTDGRGHAIERKVKF